jgi:AraC-like DNA-binding protein
VSALIRVEDEPPGSRLDYFRHVIANEIVPYDMRLETDRALQSHILTGQVGALHVTRLSIPASTASRSARLIHSSDPELFKIDVPIRGRVVLVQDHREAALAPGDFTLMDLSRPSQLAFREDTHDILTLMFSPTALPLPRSALDRLTAVPMSGRDGLGAPISSLARHIAFTLEDQRATDGVRLAAALMDLLVVMLAGQVDRTTTVGAAAQRRALLASVQAFIDNHVADPRLSPSTIAAANHISLRYLHKLFEGQGTSVGGWIKGRRLESCHRDLLNPSLAAQPVNAIALRWGFVDPARFSRAFRDAYGQPPGEYRRLHLALRQQ